MEALARTGNTAAFTSGLLTATGAEKVYDTTAAISYCIDGVLYSKATVTDGVTPTTDANTGAAFVALSEDQGCTFLWLLNAAGTVAVAQGPVRDLDPDSGAFEAGPPQLPAVPDGYCPFAYQIVKYTGSSTWLFGTGNWNASGVTDAIKNISTLPSRPPNDATS